MDQKDKDIEKVVLNGGHAHEVLDRTHIVLCNIEEFLLDHPFVLQSPEVQEELQAAAEHMAEAYTKAGMKAMEMFPEEYGFPESREDAS